jgi:hypothetical protein
MSSSAQNVYTQGQMHETNIVLTDEDVQNAKEELYDNNFTKKYPQVNRYWADPTHLNQNYCLHSFAPTPGAKPDKDGVYGFMKCRGVFQTESEADQRAEWLIRNVDSFHAIRTSFVGKPFPVIANKSKYVLETNEVDIKKKAVETVTQDLRKMKEEEKYEIKTMKQREQELLQESKNNEDELPQDPIEKYTVLHVKKAQSIWTYLETQSKMEQLKKGIKATLAEIEQMKNEDPTLEDQYYEHYMKARREAHLPEDDDSFMKYLGNDLVEKLDWLD